MHLAFLWLAITGTALAKPPPTWTSEALIAANLEARGGAARLDAITSLRAEGTLIGGGGQSQLAWVELRARPDLVRDELTMQGLTRVTAWDGHEAWTINPFRGRRDPERIPTEDAKRLIEAAPIVGALQWAKAAGWTIRYLGTDDVEGTAAHELEIANPNGDLQYVWLDPDCFLEIRLLSRRMEHGSLVESQLDYSDYELVNGAWFPFLIEMGGKGTPSAQRAKIQLDSMTANVPIDAATFAFPTPAAR